MSEPADDLAVWYCPRHEYATTYVDGMVSCGTFCDQTVFSALPEWAKDEVRRVIIKEETSDG